MSYLSGRISFERFEISGRDVKVLDESHVESLSKHAIGKTGAITADGVEVGFTAGAHLLDLQFGLEKNIVNDALVFGLRVDTNKIPGDLLKAYTQMELSAMLAASGLEYPNKAMRLEAKQVAEDRCNEEGKTGKFRKMKQFPVLWDIRNKVVLFGGTNLTAIERFASLFKEAFGRNLTRRTSGVIGYDIAKEAEKTRSFEDLSPTSFTGPSKSSPISWITGELGMRDFLGNEFLLWLWWHLDAESDVITLPDDSTATCMMAKTLSLECPLAETGKETISSESPVKLPEAKRAVQAGKLPRRAGLIVVRHDQQYEFTLQAESFAVSGGSLPKLESAPGRAEQEERVDQIREMVETIDLLFGAFLAKRMAGNWRDEAKRIRDWLDEG